ncbi:hypothetical protein [Pseudomonas sp. PLMAX]|uniref:hypothetical protein n=1 Tax=Pseudomonas sp. PLMAX TaxID=2201998 RepID=UPI0038B8C8C7
MGGNALAPYGAKRVSKEVAGSMLQGLQSNLALLSAAHGITARCEPIRAYRDKPDFGDLDVLVENTLFKVLPSEKIVAALQGFYDAEIPWIKNGPVLSIGLPLEEGGCLQADLISTPAVSFDFSAGYFAWNDLGNLVGRVAHKLGVKLGHDGLWLPMRDGTNLFDEILITHDFEEAIGFLGFDSEAWARGFDSLDQIYAFVVEGSRFNADIYKLENRNHTARVRDRKRPVYMGFLQWVEQKSNLNAFEWNADKSVYLKDIFAAFPETEKLHKASLERLAKTQAMKGRFNGQIVSDLTGLSGKDLGHFMGRFKTDHAALLGSLETVSDAELAAAIKTAFQDGDFKQSPKIDDSPSP